MYQRFNCSSSKVWSDNIYFVNFIDIRTLTRNYTSSLASFHHLSMLKPIILMDWYHLLQWEVYSIPSMETCWAEYACEYFVLLHTNVIFLLLKFVYKPTTASSFKFLHEWTLLLLQFHRWISSFIFFLRKKSGGNFNLVVVIVVMVVVVVV